MFKKPTSNFTFRPFDRQRGFFLVRASVITCSGRHFFFAPEVTHVKAAELQASASISQHLFLSSFFGGGGFPLVFLAARSAM